MPSSKAVLRDIADKGLDPRHGHVRIASDGRLSRVIRAATIIHAVEVPTIRLGLTSVLPIEEPVDVSVETHVDVSVQTQVEEIEPEKIDVQNRAELVVPVQVVTNVQLPDVKKHNKFKKVQTPPGA